MSDRPDPPTLAPAARTAVAAIRAAGGGLNAASDAEIASGVRALLASEAGRAAGVLPALAAFTRALVTESVDGDAAESVPRVLDVACGLASEASVARRRVAMTVVRAAMDHPGMSGRAGDALLSALLDAPSDSSA